MIGPALKKFAKLHSMKISRGVAYGSFYGYAATFSEGAGWKRIVISTRFPDPAKRDVLRTAMAQNNLSTMYRVRGLEIFENGVSVLFFDNPGTMEKINAFCQWFFPLLEASDATKVDICCECGEPILEDGCWKMFREVAYHLHGSCAHGLKEKIDADEVQRRKEETGSYAAGFVGAILGALLGAVVWGVVKHFGLIAGIVGFLIGFLAEKGYTLLKGKQGIGKVYILAAVTILGVLLGNLGHDVVLWVVEISKYAPNAAIILNGMEIPISYGDIPMLIGYFLANDGVYRSGVIINCLMGIFFALLGVWGILRKAKWETTVPKLIDLE